MPGQIGGPLARLSYLATSVPGKDDPISEECPSVLDLTRVEVIHQLVSRHVYILEPVIYWFVSTRLLVFVCTSSACTYYTHCSPHQCLSLAQKLSNHYNLLEKKLYNIHAL